jgi:carboxyl-terminal processing protease
MSSPSHLARRRAPSSLWLPSLCALLGCLIGLLLPIPTVGGSPHSTSSTHARALARFRLALDTITLHHVDSPDPDALIFPAIHASLSTLDRHSQLFEPDAYRRWRARIHGHRTGPGFDLSPRQGRFFISDISPGSPAAALGMTIGDEILSIDGSPLSGVSPKTIFKMLEGDEGTSLSVQWRHDPHDDLAHPTRTVTLVRTHQRAVAVRSALIDDTILHVRVERFQDGVSRDILEQSRKIAAASAPLQGLILDLRGNLGGLLNEAILMADLFLPPGRLIVSLKGNHGSLLKSHTSAAEVLLPYPVIVLIDHRSASASEIVAAALQDHRRALIVGRVSYGKGSVQSTYPLPDGSGLKITTSHYFTPLHRKIDALGVFPDVAVPASSLASPHLPASTSDSDDVPLQVAVSLLRAHHILTTYALAHPAFTQPDSAQPDPTQPDLTQPNLHHHSLDNEIP